MPARAVSVRRWGERAGYVPAGPLTVRGGPQALGHAGPTRYSLTPPSSEPEMMRFWKMKNITATGIVMRTAAASFSG